MRKADLMLAAAVVAVVGGAFVARGQAPPTASPEARGAGPTATSSPSSSPTTTPITTARPDPLDALVLEPAALEALPPTSGHPDRANVGGAACARCHADVVARFAGRPMARTGLHRVTARTPALDAMFDGARTVTHAASGFSYRAAHDADGYFVEERLEAPDGRPIHVRREPITVSFTAGALGTAFGFERGGRVYQVPIDWYPQQRVWAMDPGFVQNGRFSRQFGASCLACHGEGAPSAPTAGSTASPLLADGIGCERCHGPGGRHVETTLREDVVNPARLPFARQLEVCAQCHLEGTAEVLRAGVGARDYVPGAPLHAHQVQWVEAKATPDWFTLTSASDRLVRSACFTSAPGKLGCTTCHDVHGDAHAPAAARVQAVCVGCHTPSTGGRACTGPDAERRARQDACPSCHMARDTPGDFRGEVPGVRLDVTDHWIRARPQTPGPLGAPPPLHRVTAIVPWARLVGDESEDRGDLAAIEALAELQSGLAAVGTRGLLALPPKPVPLAAFARFVGDVYAARADAVAPASASHRHAAERLWAARAMEAKLAPDDVEALVRLARAAIALGGADAERGAEVALQHALALAPQDADALLELGGLWFRAGRVEAAVPLLERAAAVGTDVLEAHVVLAVLARQHGDARLAARRFEAARREAPRDRWILAQLRALYATLPDPVAAEEIAHALAFAPTDGPAPDLARATRWLPVALR